MILLLTHSDTLALTWQKALSPEACRHLQSFRDLEPQLRLQQLVLVDLSMPGLAACDWPGLCLHGRVIALSSAPSNPEGVAWITRGAAGYAHAYSTPDLLKQVVATVASGACWIGRDLLGLLCMQVGNHLSRDGIDGPGALLTEREREVVQALRRGLANKEIARELDISENTVKKHLSSVFQKLGVEDRLQLLIKLA